MSLVSLSVCGVGPFSPGPPRDPHNLEDVPLGMSTYFARQAALVLEWQLGILLLQQLANLTASALLQFSQILRLRSIGAQAISEPDILKKVSDAVQLLITGLEAYRGSLSISSFFFFLPLPCRLLLCVLPIRILILVRFVFFLSSTFPRPGPASQPARDQLPSCLSRELSLHSSSRTSVSCE